jgi:hypothetical protein
MTRTLLAVIYGMGVVLWAVGIFLGMALVLSSIR